jgi:flagellar motor switch protein FliN/FliY
MAEEEQIQETPSPAPEPEEISSPDDQSRMDLILDIPMQLTVELGRTHMLIQDLLQLANGSVIELSKNAGEPLEILVNNKLIAKGEVVKVNGNFGIRISEILSPAERVEQMG